MRWLGRVAMTLLIATSCGDDADPGLTGGTGGETTAPSCPAGTASHASGEGCVAVLAESCGPGTMPVRGSVECVPVGPEACPRGFAPHGSGYGCVDGLGAACSGATRDDLEAAGCVAIGDCAASPFDGATVFVDDSFTDDELDETHVRTLAEGLSAAPDGAVIGVEAGTYVEAIAPSADVTIVGRCAEQVVVHSPGGAAPGIALTDAVQVSVSGLTLTGHRGGVVVQQGTLLLEEVLLDDNREIGILAVGTGSEVALQGSVVRGTSSAANGALGRGIDIEAGARVTLSRSSVVSNREIGIFVEGGGSEVELTSSVVRSTDADGAGLEGRGVNVRMGASARVIESVVAESTTMGVFAAGAGTSVSLERSVVRDTRVDGQGMFGRGVSLIEGAAVTLVDSTVAGNRDSGISVEDAGTLLSMDASAIVSTTPVPDGRWGFGLTLRDGSSAELSRTAVSQNQDLGVVAVGGSVALADSLVEKTIAAPAIDHGFGLAVIEGASLSVERSAIVDHQGMGLLVGTGAVASLVDTIVRGNTPTPGGRFGFGLLAVGARADVTSTTIAGSASVGLFYAAASGLIATASVHDNAIGLQTQEGSALLEPATAPPELGPLEVVLVGTSVVGNERRLGSDVLPVPSLEEILGLGAP